MRNKQRRPLTVIKQAVVIASISRRTKPITPARMPIAVANMNFTVFVLIKGVSAGRDIQKRREDYTVFNHGLHGLFTDRSQGSANRGELVVEDCA
jgi:hypothetical protein